MFAMSVLSLLLVFISLNKDSKLLLDNCPSFIDEGEVNIGVL